MTQKHKKYDLSHVPARKDGWVRFLHTADWHWGFSGSESRFGEYSTLRIQNDKYGNNPRTLDVKHAMEQIPLIAEACSADFTLNAGDSWDSWGYRRPYINNVYTNIIYSLIENDRSYVEVLGNHDLPTEYNRGAHLSSIERIPNVHVVYQNEYVQIHLEKYNVVIHAVPSPNDPLLVHDMLAQVEPVDGKINIGMAHTGVSTIPHYVHNNNGVVVELDELIRCGMDYFALGDFHEAKDLGYNIHYSGSIERFGFDEIKNLPQVKIVDIHPETKEVIVTPVFLEVRPMIDLPMLDARNLSIEALNENIMKAIKAEDLSGKIVRFKIRYLESDKKPYIDFDAVKELTQDALYFDFDYVDKIDKLKEAQIELQRMGSLADIWDKFAKSYECDPEFQEAFEKEGRKGLEEAIDELTI